MNPCCKKYLLGYTGRLGLGACGCGAEWYHFTPGWAKKWGTDRVYHLGAFKGVHEGMNLKEIMKS